MHGFSIVLTCLISRNVNNDINPLKDKKNLHYSQFVPHREQCASTSLTNGKLPYG
jgi:hypothetical protein